MAIFSLYHHVAERAKEFSGVSFVRPLMPFMKAPTSWSYHHPKAPPPTTITLGIEFQCMNFEGRGAYTNIQSTASLLSRPSLGSYGHYSVLKELQPCGNYRTLDCVDFNFQVYSSFLYNLNWLWYRDIKNVSKLESCLSVWPHGDLLFLSFFP